MARPVRNAAEKARMLIASGFNIERDEDQDDTGLSPEEEDILDGKLTGFISESDDDLCSESPPPVRSKARGKGGSKPYKSYCDDDEEPVKVPFKPCRPSGPHLVDRTTASVPGRFTRAIDFFQLFFTPQIIRMLCDSSNIYGWINILEKQSYSRFQDGAWEEITTEEMYKFIGLIILMGIVVLPEISLYWNVTPPFSGGWARRFMARNRFKAISGLLHISDPTEEVKSDKLTKVRSLLTHMKKVSKELLQPCKHIVVDERMVRSKGRSGIRQFMPKKPVRFGLKLWCLCESKSGYTIDFNVYTGKQESPGKHGLAYDVVTTLLADYYRQGYNLFIDNYYTSLPLARALLDNGVLTCGTMLQTRRGFPKELTDKQWPKRVSRGAMRYIRQDNLLFLQWKDSKPVQVCSTMHKGNPYVMVKRNMKDAKGKYKPKFIRKPISIHEYNKKMGAVDLADQIIEPYNVLIKTQRWWKVLFFHMIDVGIVNSYILFTEWRKMYPDEPGLDRPAGYSHMAFRLELLKQLGGISDDEDVPTCPPQNRVPLYSIFHTEHIPVSSNTRHNCKICYCTERKENKTKWFCPHPACHIHLCHTGDRNCMALWHSSSFDGQRQVVLDALRHSS